MEYIYAALLLDKLGKSVNLENVKKIIEAAGATPDENMIKALVAALEGINIQEAISKAVPVVSTPTQSVSGGGGGESKTAKKEEKKEEKKSPEEAAAGLGSLFG